MIPVSVERLLYLVAAVLFVVGLKRLQSPETARRGNQVSALGMLIAIVVTLMSSKIGDLHDDHSPDSSSAARSDSGWRAPCG